MSENTSDPQTTLKPKGQPPETLEGLRELIDLQERAGAFEAAATVLQAYLDQNPQTPWVQSELCRCLLRLGRIDDADKVLDDLRSHMPSAPGVIGLEGLKLQLLGQTADAKKQYQQALATQGDTPDEALVWIAYNLARLHADAAEDEACERWLDHVIELQPDHFAARFQRALLYSRTERPDKCQQELAATINVNPLMLPPYLMLSEVKLREGDLATATETLLYGLKANPLAHPLREALARLFTAVGDPEAAFGVRLELCRLRGNVGDFLELGKAALLKGSMEHAVVAYTKAINEAPKDWRGYYNLAEVHRGHSDYDGAFPLYQKALELEPCDLVCNGFALWHLEAESQKADPARALELLDKALAVNPTMPEALYNRVLALAVLKRVDDAAAALDALKQGIPADHPLAAQVDQLETAIAEAAKELASDA